MTTVRQAVEAMLTPYLPAGWMLIDYTVEPDVLSRPLVMVNHTTLAMGPTLGVLEAGVEVIVCVPQTGDTRGNEDAVDAALPFVVDVLTRVNAVISVTATRGTFPPNAENGTPAWGIELTVHVPIVDTEA